MKTFKQFLKESQYDDYSFVRKEGNVEVWDDKNGDIVAWLYPDNKVKVNDKKGEEVVVKKFRNKDEAVKWMKSKKKFLTMENEEPEVLDEAKIDTSYTYKSFKDTSIKFENMSGGLSIKVTYLDECEDENMYPILSVGTIMTTDSISLRPSKSEIGKRTDWNSLDDKAQNQYIDKIRKQSTDFAKKLEKLANEFDKKVLELAKKSGYELKAY